MNSDADLLQRLGRLDLYTDFQQAFGASTGLPLRLRPLEFWNLAHRGQPYENPFCALMVEHNRGCASYLQTEQRVVEAARDHPATVTCMAGLSHTAVPVKNGDRTIGFLQTGQVALELPTAARFDAVVSQLTAWGVPVDRPSLEAAYYRSRVLSPGQYEGAVRILELFARHLSALANQLTLRDAQAEPPLVRRAKAYIAGHQADPVHLEEVAHALHVSTFYFCKRFKQTTGLTFTDYLGRVRVEKAKTLLSNPQLRVSEIAYTVGFQSLTHFNRVFHRLTGQSPTRFRENGAGETGTAARASTQELSARKAFPERLALSSDSPGRRSATT